MANSFVVLVGRPNVGKSTLFNRLVGERMSVVDDQPGTTRDRVQAPVEWRGTQFTLVDTGGLEPLEPLRSKDAMAEGSSDFVQEIRQQVEIAIDNADVILFTVDAKTGLTAGDEAVADILRKQIGLRQRAGKRVPPVIVVASKGDSLSTRNETVEFYQLGLGDVYPVSGVHGDGTGDLLDAVVAVLPPEEPAPPDESIKMALVGRPNVGKSSLFNQLIGEPRVIVSDVPGTTRDAIDTRIEYVDTADDGRRRANDGAPALSHGSGDEADEADEQTELTRHDRDSFAAEGEESFEGEGFDGEGFEDEGEGDFEIEPEDEENIDDEEFVEELGDEENSGLSTHVARPEPGTPHSTLITLIDTAGIRKRGAIDVGVEKYSVLRAFKAIERSDVALLVIDAVDGITAQDEHVAGFILDVNKSAVVVVNKWDTVESAEKVERAAKPLKGMGLLTQKMRDFIEAAQRRFNFMAYVPIIFVSAKTGFRCDQILPTALRVHEARTMRIPTSDVNRILREASEKHAPPSRGGRRLKIYYASQVGVDPPTFVFHVNDPEMVHFTYQRFLENKIRDEFGFLGTPIRLTFKGRRAKEG